jgi:hypothetical protein
MSTANALIPQERLTVKSLVSSLELFVWLRGDDLSASLGRHNNKKFTRTSAAFATSPIGRTFIEIHNNFSTLWIGSAAFDVASKNGELLVTKFGIRREDCRKESA